MCLIHDLGEAFTGDIPTFQKTTADEIREDELLTHWIASLPESLSGELSALYEEMAQRQTLEARIFKALDGLEALIQHNVSDLSTWTPNEYRLNLTYADDKTAFSSYLTQLRQAIREDTVQKLEAAKLTEKQ
jgi:putative hydrolase of HD superfamily